MKSHAWTESASSLSSSTLVVSSSVLPSSFCRDVGSVAAPGSSLTSTRDFFAGSSPSLLPFTLPHED
ncbi:hypothetical protein RRG08_020730 [Elysia crispata]|uniref:Uncharacterized protein n=1 Tax=Elysia crispata TaxID=231223 RepID=A0AAE0Z855_9GAST|nr:hypothetical protein RRG08_020730 [Elysia crispata]